MTARELSAVTTEQLVGGLGARRFRYEPSLDGLRALAIGAVLAYHAGWVDHAGYFGVTVFFVISGYLITRLLVQEVADTGSLSFRAFYRRRVARLGPALAVVLAATVVVVAVVERGVVGFWPGLIGASTYTTDILLPVAGAAHLNEYFGYTWSLGVEEQFYLLWPLLLLLALRRFRPTQILWGLVPAVALCWAIRTGITVAGLRYENLNFTPYSQFDGLVLGCMIAFATLLWDSPTTRGLAHVAAPVGLLGLAVIYLRPHSVVHLGRLDPGGYGTVALLSACLVFGVAVLPGGHLAKVFAWRPLVFVGMLSYGLYLWNIMGLELFRAATHRDPSTTPWGWLWLAGVVSVAVVSFYVVERPLRRMLAGRSHRDLARSSVATPAASGAVA